MPNHEKNSNSPPPGMQRRLLYGKLEVEAGNLIFQLLCDLSGICGGLNYYEK
jgi:hypothetical protein